MFNFTIVPCKNLLIKKRFSMKCRAHIIEQAPIRSRMIHSGVHYSALSTDSMQKKIAIKNATYSSSSSRKVQLQKSEDKRTALVAGM